MFIFLQLEYDLCFHSVHLQDEHVVLLEGLLLVVGVHLLFVELLAHVHDQLLHGGNFYKLFLNPKHDWSGFLFVWIVSALFYLLYVYVGFISIGWE